MGTDRLELFGGLAARAAETTEGRLGSGVPELPEVECVRRSLVPHVVGATIASVRVERADVVGSRAGRRGRVPAVANAALRRALLEGTRIEGIDRRGKQLALVADSGAGVVVHLGMSGRMTLAREADKLLPHTHVVWSLSHRRGGEYTQVRFVDPRRFGFLLPFASREELGGIWAAMGPDALMLAEAGEDRAAVGEAIRGTKRAIKPALLDQSVAAGIGNIYADEACFAARLDPHRAGRSLTPDEVGRLLDAVARVLKSAIDCGGSTLRDYADALGARGSAQGKHAVYGRAVQPCLVCGGVLASDRLGQRATVWCPRCQA